MVLMIGTVNIFNPSPSTNGPVVTVFCSLKSMIRGAPSPRSHSPILSIPYAGKLGFPHISLIQPLLPTRIGIGLEGWSAIQRL